MNAANLLGRGLVVRNRRTALALGVGFTLLGSRMLYDAYEARGVKKPWPIGVVF